MNKLIFPDVEAYAQAHSMRESDLCRALREETAQRMESPQMIVGPLEGAFLKMMTQLVRATSVLEIGMFTGYSALCFAEALPADGKVLTCEIDEESAVLARQYFARSPMEKKIEIRMGPALDTMRYLKGPFDLIFIDADKPSYVEYLDLSLQLAQPGTVILADNVIRNGRVLDDRADEAARGVKAFNDALAANSKLESIILPIIRTNLDGLAISLVK